MPITKKREVQGTSYNFRISQSNLEGLKALCRRIGIPVSAALNEYIEFAIKTQALISRDDELATIRGSGEKKQDI